MNYTGREIKKLIKSYGGDSPQGVVFEDDNLNRFIVKDNKVQKTYSYTMHSLTKIYNEKSYRITFCGEVSISRVDLGRFLRDLKCGLELEEWIPSKLEKVPDNEIEDTYCDAHETIFIIKDDLRKRFSEKALYEIIDHGCLMADEAIEYDYRIAESYKGFDLSFSMDGEWFNIKFEAVNFLKVTYKHYDPYYWCQQIITLGKG